MSGVDLFNRVQKIAEQYTPEQMSAITIDERRPDLQAGTELFSGLLITAFAIRHPRVIDADEMTAAVQLCELTENALQKHNPLTELVAE